MNIYKSNVLIFDIKVSFQLVLGFFKQSINNFIFYLYFYILFLSQQTWKGKLFIFGISNVKPFKLLIIIISFELVLFKTIK